MSLHSIEAAGLRTIRHMIHLHSLSFHTTQNGLAVTIELPGSSLPGAPVLNSEKQYVGFIGEFDVLHALQSGRELNQLTAENIMVRDHLSVSPYNTIREAVELMKMNHILVLPVEEDGLEIGCLTRKDLLRAWTSNNPYYRNKNSNSFVSVNSNGCFVSEEFWDALKGELWRRMLQRGTFSHTVPNKME